MGSTEMSCAELAERYQQMRSVIGASVVGQEAASKLAFVALLSGGHALFQGVPGVAKTLLVRSLAAALGLRFGRVQFTPDLMPSDVIGSPILQAERGELRFRPGPIFTDLLLGDEINRAPAKTQAAMLEAMQERAVTVDGTRHDLGPYFTVFATQNPVEQEGTYPLPEAELDRFLFRIDIGYPAETDERKMLAEHHARDPMPSRSGALLTGEQLDAGRETVRRVVVRDELLGYVLSLVRATRDDANLTLGGSPRAGLWLVRAAKANAALAGRDYALPEDVQEVFAPVFRHRVVLEPAAEVDGLSSDDALSQVLRRVPVPH
jgi:MoxR-like ATPase